ncbi:MAG: cell division protein FtsA [Flavobacteriales bacterium]|nr:cell division protein FtsA [Flavobacteriales bacterium]
MNNPKIVVGLDIGTTKICAIVGRANEYGKVDILGIGKVPSNGGVTRGIVSNIDRTVAAITEAINMAQEVANVNIRNVQVGIAGAHISSLQHRGMLIRNDSEKEIDRSDLEKLEADMYKLAVKPGDKILHVIPQDYMVDDEPGITYPIGMSGVKLEGNFHIITGQITAAKNIYKCVEKTGLKVSDLTLEPLASAMSVLSEEEMEAGIVLVDIGGGTTDVAIFHENIIRHTAVIPYGGNIITEDIKEGCNVVKHHAESLKTKFGSALASEASDNEIITIPGLKGRDPKEISVKNLARIIQARMSEILELVYFEIKSSGLEKKLAGGIVLTGGGAMLKHITHLASLETGLDARVGYPNEHIAKGLVDEVKSPIYATGIGLVMKGLQSSFLGDNLPIEESEVDEKSANAQSGKGKSKWIKFDIDILKNWFKDDGEFTDFEK